MEKTLTNLASWKLLLQHKDNIKNIPLKDLFQNEKNRFNNNLIEAAGLQVDFSKNIINSQTKNLLFQLAQERNLTKKIDNLISGKIVNFTENRPAWHTELRNPKPIEAVKNSLQQMQTFTKKIHNNPQITTVVNIGIGGSHLGPAMIVQALRHLDTKLNCFFVSNLDPLDIEQTLDKLTAANTLFIISSKTFTTQETLTNAKRAKQWLIDNGISSSNIKNHLVAVSAAKDKAQEFGINIDNIFEFWDWVGGRYSLWSPIGLSIALTYGMNCFKQLLAGAHAMDLNFQNKDFNKNLPAMLGLLGIWYQHFWGASTYAVLPYAENLNLFVDYLQQLDMESNGKSCANSGLKCDYTTGPVVWGGIGTNGQHAFHQLLHQGTHFIPIDFILPLKSKSQQHMQLVSHCLAQSKALMDGQKTAESYKFMPGNKPSTIISFDELTPYNLGALIALYEHKVYVQSVILDINPFDQWGVELGKIIAKELQHSILNNSNLNYDGSTNNLIKIYNKINNDKTK